MCGCSFLLTTCLFAWLYLHGAAGSCAGTGLFKGSGRFTGSGTFRGSHATIEATDSKFESTNGGTFEGEGHCEGEATFVSHFSSTIFVTGDGLFHGDGMYKDSDGEVLDVDGGQLEGSGVTFIGTGGMKGVGRARGKLKVSGDNFTCTGTGKFFATGGFTGEGWMITADGQFVGTGTLSGTGSLKGRGSCDGSESTLGSQPLEPSPISSTAGLPMQEPGFPDIAESQKEAAASPIEETAKLEDGVTESLDNMETPP